MKAMFRTVGLTVAMFAMAAVGASGAQAAQFHSESQFTTLSGEQVVPHVLSTNAGTVHCEEWAYSGATSSKISDDVALYPHIADCIAFGFLNATVKTNGCKFVLEAPGSGPEGTLEIVCPEKQGITMSVFGCTVKVGPQTVGPLEFHNEGVGNDRSFVIDEGELTGITYEQSGFWCGGKVTYNNGTLTGATQLQGSSGGMETGVWVE